MAEKESSENPPKNWIWGCLGQHFAPHFCAVDSIHRHLLTDLRDAALPHHLIKYTPPPGGLTAVVIVMVTAQIHQGSILLSLTNVWCGKADNLWIGKDQRLM